MLLEIRSTGMQTVFPGSIHPSGEKIEWYEDGRLGEVTSEDLFSAVGLIASICAIARRWPGEGGRHDAQLTLSAWLIRARWPVLKVAQFVEAVSIAAGASPDLEKRMATARDAQRRLSQGQKLRGFSALSQLIGDKVAHQVSGWLGIADSSRGVDSRSIPSKTGLHAAPAVLKIGSDVEIAKSIVEDLRDAHGDLVFDQGAIWYFDGVSWQPKSTRDVHLIVHRYDGVIPDASVGRTGQVKLGKQRIDSILSEVMVLLDQKDFFAQASQGMNCAGGFIAFSSDGHARLQPHAPDHRCRYVLNGRWPIDLDEEHAAKSLLSKLLRGVFAGDQDAVQKIDLIAEIAAAAALAMAPQMLQPRAVVLLGRAAENGKSQVLDLIRGMLPAEAVAAVPPHRFKDDKYLIQLAGKLLNATDEMSSAAALGGETFKAVITGDPVMARDVYRPALQFRCCAQHIFAANQLPPFKGGMDRGIRRRVRVVAFDRTIPIDERIPMLGRRICRDEPDLVLDFVVQGASRLLRRLRFAEPTSSLAAEREWMTNADPVIAWLENEVTIDATAPPVLVRDVHSTFGNWARAEGYAETDICPVNVFSQRVIAADPAIKQYRTQSKRYLRGIRLLQAPLVSDRAQAGIRRPR